MGDFFGPNVEIIKDVSGVTYRKITYPDGRTEMDVISPPPFYSAYSSGEAVRDMNGRLTPPFSSIYNVDAIETTTLGDTSRTWRASRGPKLEDYVELRKYLESEEESKVNVVRKKSYNEGEHIVACCDEKDLSVENVLKTLSAIKGKLMIDIAPIHVKTIECWITPQVRQNIVTASKKLKMYGKKRPIIARFDEYGNRLPDEIDIGTTNGITLKIIDPDKYGKYYIELKGIEFPRIEPDITKSFEDTYIDPDDLPF